MKLYKYNKYKYKYLQLIHNYYNQLHLLKLMLILVKME